jgi:hypothetical protein
MRTLFSLLSILFLTTTFGQAIAATISGTVSDPNGKPVGGADVRVYLQSSTSWQPALQTTTSADGEFSVDVSDEGIKGGRCIVTAAGLSAGGGYVALNQSNSIHLALPATISGTVVDTNQKPVSGATVKVRTVSVGSSNPPLSNGSMIFADIPGEARLTTQTDSQGRYSFSNLPQNSTTGIELMDPRFATVTQDDVKAGTTAHVIVARPAAVITGKVAYDGGAPVPDIQAEAEPMGAASGWAEANTDATGAYKLQGLSTGSYNVIVEFAQDSAWIAPAAEGVVATEGSTVSAPDIVAVHGAVISGLVTDSGTGKPVEGAMVGCYGPQRPSSSSAITMATSNALGAYSLRVAPGSNKVYMSGTPDAYLTEANSSMTTLTVAEGDAKQIDFQLKRGLSASGTAVDPSGKPVPNVTISLRPVNGVDYDPFGSPQASTDQDGNFTVNKLAPGAYTVTVAGYWQVKSPDQVRIPVSEPIGLALSPIQELTLSGKAFDQSGNPIAGVQLNFMVLTPIGNGMSTGQSVVESTDSNGEFTLPDLRPDNQVSATVSKDGFALVSGGQVTVKDGAFSITDVVMAPLNASIAGVVCSDKGAPIVGAWVVAASNAGPDRPVQTDSAGRFAIAGMMPGEVDIYAAKGNLSGRGLFTAVTSAQSAGHHKQSLSLESNSPLKSADFDRGYTILSDLHSASGSGSYYAAGSVAAEIGAYDPDAAIRLLSAAGQTPSDTDVMQIIQGRAQLSPRAADAWGYPRILSMQDPDARAEAAVMLGLFVARADPETARALFSIAKSSGGAAAGGQFGQYIGLQLPALAAALNLPETRSLLDQAIAQCRKGPSTPGQSMLELLAMFMAGGSTDLAGEVINKLPQDQQSRAQQDLVNGVLQMNPAGAIDLARKMESEDPTDFNFGKVADAAIEEMGKSDPQAALNLAQSVQVDYSQSIVLADAADFLPMSQAADLYRKAAALTLSAAGSRATPAMIAAKAWLRDKMLGSELFDTALKSCKPSDPLQAPSPEPVADFAFYYARVDPAFSRTLLEKAYATDGASTDQGRSYNMKADAMAMAAVDVDRALEMAYAIPDVNPRFDAVRKIGQYVLAPESTRLTMPFDRWKASDTWIPGTPTMW